MPERACNLRERSTTVRTEVLSGVTTFVAMAYITVVDRLILSFAVGIGLLRSKYYLFCLPH